jgi:DNA repair protein RadC
MNDHDTLASRPDDIAEAGQSPSASIGTPPANPARASDPEPIRAIPDATTRLVADVLGMTAERTAEVLKNLGGLKGLAHAAEAELLGASVPRSRARLVRAAFELGRLSIGERPQLGQHLTSSSDVWLHMQARLSGLPVEEFWAIALDVRHRVILDSMIGRGSLSGVEVHPRDTFRALIRVGASAVIFVHNHPSGMATPSEQDIEITKRLREVGDLCGITVLDHVVVASTGHVSMRERGWR